MMKLIGSLALAATLLLGACGGGGDLAPCGSGSSLVNAILDQGKCSSSPATAATGTGASPTVTAASMTLSLTDAAGAVITSVSPARAGTLQARIVDSRGAGVASVAVTFTTTDKTGTLMPTSGSALTDANGVTSVGLPAGTQAGAYTVTASASVGGLAVKGTIDYAVTSANLSLSPLSLALLDASGAAMGSVSRDRDGTLQATLKDDTGKSVPNVVVSFTTSDKTGSFVPALGTALTDASGVARLGLVAGTQTGAFTATAAITVGGVTSNGSINYVITSPSQTLSPLALSLADASGAAITSVAPDRAGVLKATVKDSKGVGIPNIALTFSTSDKTGVFVPSSGTALTDASGVATVGLPSGAQTGAFVVTVNATVGATAATGSLGYMVTFPTLALGPLTIAPSPLSAGGTASIGVAVLSGAVSFAPAQSVTFTSPCATAGKAVISSPVITMNGVANTSYTDKGCGGVDTITASTSLGGATFSKSASVNVLAPVAGQIAFVSALPQNIAMKGTGGPGRQESSVATFAVLDKNGNPISGIAVDFSLTTTVGGLELSPAFATSGANGTVSTVVAAGIVNTPVRVLAKIRDSALSTVSDQLVISTGIPDQNSFTVTPKIYNIECADHDGTDFTTVTAFVADHFNNPVPDGTAISLTTEGGAIDASCLTGLSQTTLTDGSKITQKGVPGQCTVRFICQNPHPADGRSTVLAYALGEESFTDNPDIRYGINRYDVGETFQDLREPFRYDRAVTNRQAKDVNNGNNNAVAPGAGEPFIDTDGDGLWNAAGDGFYNGVLQSVPNAKTPTVHVRDSMVLVFSGSDAVITALNPVPLQLSHCVDGIPFVNVPTTLRIAIRDGNPTVFAGNAANTAPLFLPLDLPGNILPAGTNITFSASNGTILSETSYTVPNTNEPSAAAWIYSVLIQSDAIQSSSVANPPLSCSNQVGSGLLKVKVTTPLGITTTQSYSVTD